MNDSIAFTRTDSEDPAFLSLVEKLDYELWNELKEDQATYDAFNRITGLNTVLIARIGHTPVACGCFKHHAADTVEIKRMFVDKPYRGRGISRKLLAALEQWAKEKGYDYSVLETSVHFKTARGLYEKAGYSIIDNYGQYTGLAESVCMKKRLDNR